MAIEWAKYNIHVNSIAPYAMETDMTSAMLENEKIKKAIISTIYLMNRIGQPAHLSGVVVFLASKASDYITERAIFVDRDFSVQ